MCSKSWRATATSCIFSVIGLLASVVLASAEMAAPPFNCEQAPSRPRAGGASVEQGSNENPQSKNWQPIGGLIEFKIDSFTPIDPTATVTTCFRWKIVDNGASTPVERLPMRVDMTNGGKTLKVTVEIPDPGEKQPRSHFDRSIEHRIWLVPLAEVRIVALKDNTVLADVRTDIGITRPSFSLVLALIVVILGLVALNIVVNYRVKHDGILKAHWFLRIISTPAATASLSQLQMLIWTFVVAAATVYVATVSGQLVEITTGTLVLLGISGATTLAAQAYIGGQAAKQPAAQPDPDAAAPDAAVAAQKAQQAQQAAGNRRPPDDQIPRWSDLIINDQNTAVREIDVARVQMLLFTLISAVFVITKVIAAYVIPEIPVGYLTLMGISNGVYVGSKMVRAP